MLRAQGLTLPAFLTDFLRFRVGTRFLCSFPVSLLSFTQDMSCPGLLVGPRFRSGCPKEPPRLRGRADMLPDDWDQVAGDKRPR